jgi:hypothetical protein
MSTPTPTPTPTPKTEKKKEKEEKPTVDLLEEDPEIPGQKFVLLSFISPENLKEGCSMRAIKIRGVFGTREEAEKYSQTIRDTIDSNFDIYVGDVGKWLPWDNKEKVEDEVYAETELNDLMKEYKNQRELSKKEMEDRRRNAVNESKKK